MGALLCGNPAISKPQRADSFFKERFCVGTPPSQNLNGQTAFSRSAFVWEPRHLKMNRHELAN
jgi:hypothetical protein